MKPTPLPPSLPGVSNPSSPSHKLELQTLKLEELTVSVDSSFPDWPSPSVGTQKSNPAASAPSEVQDLGSPVPPLSVSGPCILPRPEPDQHGLSPPPPRSRSQSSGSSCACGASQCPGPSRCSWSACAEGPRPASGRSHGARNVPRVLPGHASGLRPSEPPDGRVR